jgi:hypothetical protein
VQFRFSERVCLRCSSGIPFDVPFITSVGTD